MRADRKPTVRVFAPLVLAVVILCTAFSARANDGYDLWLQYTPLSVEARNRAAGVFTGITTTSDSPTAGAAAAELQRGLEQMLGRSIPVNAPDADRDGSVVLLTPAELRSLGARIDLDGNSPDAYAVRSLQVAGASRIVIAGNTDVGQLYGAFALLRHLATGGDPRDIDIQAAPKIRLRLLNHWDNLDRSVERGYAGQSLWDWMTLPEYRDPRYRD